MKRVKISVVLIVLLTVSGCAGVPDSDETTTYISEIAEGETPETSTELLSVYKINESSAMTHDKSTHTTFENLTDPQQTAFMRALECSCNVKQNIFDFHNENRTKVVSYNGDYYYLRVAIV